MLVDATSDRRIIKEEIFGPVVAALPFADVDLAARVPSSPVEPGDHPAEWNPRARPAWARP
ncbi:MAG: hypothetical protein ACR2IP_10755 [Solirubrobacteraceae bacterium]